MLCRKCRKEIPSDAVFCQFCGAKQTVAKQKKAANGSGSVYKRGMTWSYSFVGGWRAEDGKAVPIRVTKGGFPTKKDAQAAMETAMKNHVSVNPDAKITFRGVFERLEAGHFEKLGDSTVKGYKSAMSHFSSIELMPFVDVRVDDMQTCLDQQSGRRTKELMKALAGLMYKYALSRELVSQNRSQYLDVGNEKKGTRDAFTLAQVEMIRKAAETDERAAYTLCLIYTGFRPGEMLKLRKEDYHREDGYEYFVGGSKTEAGTDRKVTISPKIQSIVRRLVFASKGWIFCKPNGQRMDDEYFREVYFYPLLAELRMQPIPDENHPAKLVPYSCRHTFANLMKAVEGADKDKAALMGHSDAAMTRYYQSTDLDDIRKITEAL